MIYEILYIVKEVIDMARNYELSLFNEFEELNKKLDKLLQENKHQSLEIQELKEELKKYKNLYEESQKRIEKLLEENEKLKNQNNKNSGNSSKPSSTDIFRPKKTGPNLYNSRVKSGKKTGAQFKHKGHCLSKEKIEQKIKQKNIKVVEIKHTIFGNPKKEPIIKYRLGMKAITIVEKHIFEYSENTKEKLPKEFYTDVTYTNDFKSLVVFMNVQNVMSLNRLCEFFRIITDNAINLSEGTIINFMKEFSSKSAYSIDNIIENVVSNLTIYTDETTEKINKHNSYVRNYSNENSTVYKSHFHKGHNPIKEDNILPKYNGVIMGDHDTTLDSYGSKRIECNVHLGRYTVEITQNVLDAPWAEKMKTLLETGNRTREYAKAYGLDDFKDDNYEWYSRKFDEIIKEAKEETKNMSSSFYRKKSKQLYTRLEKNKEKHLAYLRNFSLPYSNNTSESDLRVYKIKLKVSGCFRSKTGSDYFADALSIIKTSKKRKENVLQNIKDIFNNKILFVN